MEAAGKGGGCQLRRLHIVYFLSRMGRTEHPHLIRVHHVSEKGVYLRDVKRWLSDLRGKGMPESFSWSYKRRYRSGYVWQDLMDDELITPISDNEYVLKGSETIPSTSFEATSQGEKKAVENEQDDSRNKSLTNEATQEHSSDFSSEIYQESPEFVDLGTKLDDKSGETQQGDKDENPSLFHSHLQNRKNRREAKTNNESNDNSIDKELDTPSCSSLSSPPFSSSVKPPFAKSKSHPSGARQKLRNLLHCGSVDTNDAVLIMLNRAGKIKPTHFEHPSDKAAEIRKGDKLGGSARVFGTPWNEEKKYIASKSFEEAKDCKKKQGAEFGTSKVGSAAYKPVGGPKCS